LTTRCNHKAWIGKGSKAIEELQLELYVLIRAKVISQ
jgi:hypothetical protein